MLSMDSDGVTVKICGLRSAEHGDWVRESGAPLAGLVFARSRRRVTVDEAQAIIAASRRHHPVVPSLVGASSPTETSVVGSPRAEQSSRQTRGLQFVGVFAGQTADDVASIATACRLDLVQLSGGEPATITAELTVRGLRVIVAVHISEGMPAQAALMALAPHVAAGAEAILLDTASAQGGGSGRSFDWQVARDVVAGTSVPVILAGGLDALNVARAVQTVHPWGVDVSSGVETDGVKDRAKIAAFVRAAVDASRT